MNARSFTALALAAILSTPLTGCMHLLASGSPEELLCGADIDGDSFPGDRIEREDGSYAAFRFGDFTWEQCMADPQYADNPFIASFPADTERDCDDFIFDLDNSCRGSYGDDDDDDTSGGDPYGDDDDDDGSAPGPNRDELTITWHLGINAPELWIEGRIYGHPYMDSWGLLASQSDASSVSVTIPDVDADMWVEFNATADMNGDGDGWDVGVDRWSCTTESDGDVVTIGNITLRYEGDELDELTEDDISDNDGFGDGANWLFRVQDLD